MSTFHVTTNAYAGYQLCRDYFETYNTLEEALDFIGAINLKAVYARIAMSWPESALKDLYLYVAVAVEDDNHDFDVFYSEDFGYERYLKNSTLVEIVDEFKRS